VTRSLGRVGILLALALVCAAPAGANHVHCGDTITQDTTLDSDLNCSGDGLVVAAGGVTVDLGGHVIGGAGSGVGVSVPWQGSTFSGVTIRGGTIRDFARGIYVDEIEDTTVSGMVLEANRTGLHCFMAAGCSVVDSVVRDNRGIGVFMAAIDVGTGRPSLVQRNRIYGNERGLVLYDYRAIVFDNRIEDNRSYGIEIGLEDLVEVIRNRIAGNGAHGVVIFADGTSNVALIGNRIVSNAGDGVLAAGGGEFGDTHVTVRENRADRNGDDGIDVDAAEFSLVAGNKAYFNADLGIEAGPATTDGGANKARHNGNPAQCVGVTCR
jgi:nitrous oxidase accessory protein NosD